jgi:hypothetical protein
MKNLIKLLCVLVLLTMATRTSAQKFAVKAGLNLSKMLLKSDNGNYSSDLKMHPGFHIGATVEIPITDIFSFEPGLLLTTKGYNYKRPGSSDYTEKLNLFYFEIPLNAKATFDVEGVKIYGAFGPYLGLGLSGKYKTKTSGVSDNSTVNWGSDSENDDLKRFDLGINVGAGVEIKSILVGINYGLGLANISSYTDGGNKAKNRVFAISFGYKLGGE